MRINLRLISYLRRKRKGGFERERERAGKQLANHCSTPIKIAICSPDRTIERSNLMYSSAYNRNT
jgi:hypothetical protein